MTIPSIYINLEDDVSKIVARLKKSHVQSLVLVCPKRCFLFNDSINLRLLKKQTDLLKKEVFILTMDEKGQMYAKEAGFKLKFLPKTAKSSGMSDVSNSHRQNLSIKQEAPETEPHENPIVKKAKELAASSGLLGSLEKGASPVKNHASAYAKVPQVLVKDVIFPKETAENYDHKSKGAKSQKALLGLVAFSLIVVLAVVFIILPKATVEVYAKTEQITRDPEVSISTNVPSPDPSRLVMPAVKVQQELEVSNTFQSQGKIEVGNKASGSVRIYNFTRAPINLKAATTTLNVGNKTYVFTQDVLGVRPTAYINAKTKEVDLSTLAGPFDIVAQSGGEDSNLPAGVRIEITNKVFGSKPQFLFAKADTAITGGTTRYLSVISAQDISGSQSALADQLLQKLRDSEKEQNLILPDKSFVMETESFSADKPIGTQSPSFQGTLKAKVTGLAFSQEILKKLIADRITQTLPDNKYLQPQTDDQFSYSFKSLDLNNGLGVLSVHFQGTAVVKAELGNIAQQLVGKSKQEANAIILSKADVDKIEITLAPSWQTKFPWFVQKIDVKVVGQ